MTYIVAYRHPKFSSKICWKNVLLEIENPQRDIVHESSKYPETVTKCVEQVDKELLDLISVPSMIEKLERFNKSNKDLFETEREKLYHHYEIPKKTGGMRPIDEPVPKLQNALRQLSDILMKSFHCRQHTAAFAYVKERNIVDCLQKHINSNWFLKTDFSGFFPNTTLDFVMRMAAQIFPLSEICKTKKGKDALEKALSLGFLNGGLPQGTVLSPFLTNLMMIPIDYKLFNTLAHRKIVYTRYADDMQISAEEKFPYRDVIKLIRDTLNEFQAPFELKDEKTRFGSVKGKNFNLGLMLNKDHNITIGHKQKKLMKAMLTNFILDSKNKKIWSEQKTRELFGRLSYCKMIEPKYFNHIVAEINKKWNVDVIKMMKIYI